MWAHPSDVLEANFFYVFPEIRGGGGTSSWHRLEGVPISMALCLSSPELEPSKH